MSDPTKQNIEEDTAYHEAGHAVMGCILQTNPLWVSIVSDGAGGVGKTEFEDDWPPGGYRYLDEFEEKKKYIRIRVLIEVAGTIAHDIKFPDRDHDQGDVFDDYWARELIAESVNWEDDKKAYLAHLIRQRAPERLASVV